MNRPTLIGVDREQVALMSEWQHFFQIERTLRSLLNLFKQTRSVGLDFTYTMDTSLKSSLMTRLEMRCGGYFNLPQKRIISSLQVEALRSERVALLNL